MDIEDLKKRLECHHQESYGWARFCCRGDAAEADNLLQTVYLKILEGRAVFEGNSAFRTWLFGVVRLTAAELRRRRALERLHLVRYLDLQPRRLFVSYSDDPVSGSERQEALRKALTSLTRRQAEVLQLVLYHDLSLAEAAEAIGVSVGSARTHYERGKKRLRALLEEAGLK